MKIKLKKVDYDQIKGAKLTRPKPKKPNIFFRTLLKIVSLPHLWAVKFRAQKIGMKKLKRKEPFLALMNHCGFIDMEIATFVFYPRPINIVATSDAFIGKSWIMRQIGCIETRKYAMDVQVVRDVSYALKTLKSSVLIYPEATYSLDGRATILPDSVGKCLKFLGVPVVTVITEGAFTRQPVYNNLRKRKVKVSAKIEYLLSPDDLQTLSADEINAKIREKFSFDYFRWQKEKGVVVDDPDRAEGLNRILYKCPYCKTEGKMKGEGVTLTCGECNKSYELTPLGEMKALGGETEFTQISDWVDWERESVKAEIDEGRYEMNLPVRIMAMVDVKTVYEIGEGVLTHGTEGFRLTGCDGKLDYKQSAGFAYTINSDFNWYQIGDVINIGDLNTQYFCFPKVEGDHAFKARLAAEELYKQNRKKLKG